jgi:hypothetical protein
MPLSSSDDLAALFGNGLSIAYNHDMAIPALTAHGQSLRIAPIAAELRFGSVRVKGRACSIATAERLALEACWAGPHFPCLLAGRCGAPGQGSVGGPREPPDSVAGHQTPQGARSLMTSLVVSGAAPLARAR